MRSPQVHARTASRPDRWHAGSTADAPPAATSPGPPASPRPPSPSSSATNGAAASPRRTAERVRDAARDLGYRPNLAARNLRLGHTRTALLVVPALTTEFFAGVYTGAARVAAEHGFGVVLYPSPEGIGPARDPFASARAALDGVIASSMAADALDRHPRRPDSPSSCSTATPRGSRRRRHRQPRHRRRHTPGRRPPPGPRPPPLPPPRRRRRLLDLRGPRPRTRRTPRATVPGTALRTVPRPHRHRRRPRRPPRRALAAPGPRPTALVCDDDILAAGACKAARRLGLRIPDDLSVTGFDDLALATRPRPRTHHRPPARRTVRRTGHAGPPGRPGRPHARPQADIPVELVVRGSTAPRPPPP